MKNIKTCLTCGFLVLAILLSGCTGGYVSESTLAENTEEETISYNRNTEETVTLEDSTYMGVSAEDLEFLRKILCGNHYNNYNSGTASEEDFIRLLTDGYVCQGLMKIAKSLTNFPTEAFSQYASGDTEDPLKLFDGSFVWIREDMFDFISQNIFGFTIPHEFDEQKESNSVYYYNEGYFYFSCMITGFEIEDIIIHDCTRQEDNRYLIKTELTGGSLETDGEIYHKAYADVLAGVAEQDGFRYWQISEIRVY